MRCLLRLLPFFLLMISYFTAYSHMFSVFVLQVRTMLMQCAHSHLAPRAHQPHTILTYAILLPHQTGHPCAVAMCNCEDQVEQILLG